MKPQLSSSNGEATFDEPSGEPERRIRRFVNAMSKGRRRGYPLRSATDCLHLFSNESGLAMRSGFLFLGVVVSFGTLGALAQEQKQLNLTIWNDSTDDIVVVVETPDEKGASQRMVEVPSRSVVHNIPLPNVNDDQFAIAYKAHATSEGLKLDSPARVVGFRRIFPRPSPYHMSRRINTMVPVLRYRSYDPPGEFDIQSGGEMGVLAEMSAQMSSLFTPAYTKDAQDLVNEAMATARQIDYQRLAPQG